MSDDPVPTAEPTPAEASGLRGARLAARVRQALYRLPAGELAPAHERMRQAATERHMDYFHEGRVETIRVLPCPITLLPEQLVYLHSITRTLHYALLRMPELYFADPAVRALLRARTRGGRMAPRLLDSRGAGRNPVFDRLDCMVDYANPIWKDTLRFVEPNLTGVGGLYLVPAVEEVVDGVVVPLLLSQDPGIRLTRLLDARILLLKELVEHLEVVGRPGWDHLPGGAQVRAGRHRRAAPAGGVLRRPARNPDAPRRPERAPDEGGRGLSAATSRWTWSTATTPCSTWWSWRRRAWTPSRCVGCSGRTG